MARRSSKKTNRSTAARTGTARSKKEKTSKSGRGRDPGPKISAVPSIHVIPEMWEDAEEENVPAASFAPKSAPIAFSHQPDACGRVPHAGPDDGTAPRGFRPQDSLTPRVMQMLGSSARVAVPPVLSPVCAAPVIAEAPRAVAKGDKDAKAPKAAKGPRNAKDPKAAKGAKVTNAPAAPQNTQPADSPYAHLRLEPAAVMDQCWSIHRAVAELGPPLQTARERALDTSPSAPAVPGDVFEMDMEADPALAWRPLPPQDDSEDWRTCACRTCARRRLRFVGYAGQPGF